MIAAYLRPWRSKRINGRARRDRRPWQRSTIHSRSKIARQTAAPSCWHRRVADRRCDCAGAYFAFGRGDDGSANQAAARQGTGVSAEQEGIVDALEKEGILPDDTDASQIGAPSSAAPAAQATASTTTASTHLHQISTVGDGRLSASSAGFVTKDDLPVLRAQVMQARNSRRP
jgi:hypothetical protein